MISFNYLASPGQLGNQMFKYAAVRGIANALQKDFLIPPAYELLNNKKVFKILNRLNLVDERNHVNHSLFKYFNMSSVNKANIGYSQNLTALKEKSFELDKQFVNSQEESFDIYGFFQSYKYFEHISNEILEDFTFKNKVAYKTYEIYNNLENPCSIHVRRGDYLTNPNHSVLDVEYYFKSIEKIGKDKQFLVFSDDVEWCRNFKAFRGENFIYSEDSTKGREHYDLSLMTLCKDHIISNSTFSWWGAWLSKSNNVIAPENWFKNSAYNFYNTEDLLPKGWLTIEN
jgi:hypothetical protein